MPDLIERDAAIKLIQPRLKPKTVYGEGYLNAIEHVTELLSLMPSANCWISCSERMPEKDGDYLCISNNEYKILPYRNGEFYCVCFDSVLRCCNSSVTHWMPLPSMPEVTNNVD